MLDSAVPAFPERLRVFAWLSVLLIICFAKPLYDLARYSFHSELYSHILLVPFIGLYLVWLKRRDLAPASEPVGRLALGPLILGLGLIAGYLLAVTSGWKAKTEDYLAMMTLSFLAFLWSGCLLCLGVATLARLAFPLAFIVFMVPFPAGIEHAIERFLQHGSAEAAYALLKLSGMPVFRQGTSFQLPGFSMEVAPQCSGIRSSLVLFITSFLAGHLLLRNNWSRALLVFAVIPLGMLRNGLRIFTLGQLCVRISPDWINSDLHKHGGPLFFAASLAPLFLLLWYLRKREQRRSKE